MKNLKEAIDCLLRDFLASRPSAPLRTVTCSLEFWDQIASELDVPLPPPSPPSIRRGHPFELDDGNTAAYASLAAALQVDTLMQQFRERYCISYVPKQARDAFIELAMDLYPKASKHSINERIRLRKKTIFEGGLSYLDEEKTDAGN